MELICEKLKNYMNSNQHHWRQFGVFILNFEHINDNILECKLSEHFRNFCWQLVVIDRRKCQSKYCKANVILKVLLFLSVQKFTFNNWQFTPCVRIFWRIKIPLFCLKSIIGALPNVAIIRVLYHIYRISPVFHVLFTRIQKRTQILVKQRLSRTFNIEIRENWGFDLRFILRFFEIS